MKAKPSYFDLLPSTVPNPKYLIQADSPSKRFKFRVVTLSGQLVGYFKHMDDATAWCEAN